MHAARAAAYASSLALLAKPHAAIHPHTPV